MRRVRARAGGLGTAVTRVPQPKLATYLLVAAVALLAAVALGRPALAATAVPFVVFVLAGALGARPPIVKLALAADPDRLVEGDDVTLTLRATGAGPQLLLELALPAPLGGRTVAVATSLAAGDTRHVELVARAERWGGFALGPAHVTLIDDFGLHAWHGALADPVPLRVYPRRELLRQGLRPLMTRPQPGTLASRARGEGLEFAELRPWAPGGRARPLHRRAPARRGQPYVTERLLERGADVVLFLDTFVTAGDGRDGTLEATVRVADSLASDHLARGDRVALVGFGGVLDWLLPGGGARQRTRIVETLIRSEIVFSYTTKDVRILPPRLLPAHALVVAITPLLDERGIVALLDLRARGYDVAAIVIPPFRFVTEPAEPLAWRLWQLRHAALRLRLEHAGIAVAAWDAPAPLDATVEEVNRFRRFTHGVRSA
jgi:uncharacterized protein (DUF58 family)